MVLGCWNIVYKNVDVDLQREDEDGALKVKSIYNQMYSSEEF